MSEDTTMGGTPPPDGGPPEGVCPSVPPPLPTPSSRPLEKPEIPPEPPRKKPGRRKTIYPWASPGGRKVDEGIPGGGRGAKGITDQFSFVRGRLMVELKYLRCAQQKGPLNHDERNSLVSIARELVRVTEAASAVIIRSFDLPKLRPSTLAALVEDLGLRTQRREQAEQARGEQDGSDTDDG